MTSQISAALQAKLKKAREKFQKAEPAESNANANRNVPDGTYTAKVVGLEFAEFGKHPVIRFTYEITDADKKSHETAIKQLVETRFNLDTDEGPSYIKRDFGKFGYDDVNDLLDDIDATNQLFLELLKLNPVVKINVAMDDTDNWQNVFLNDVLEMDDEVEEEPKPEPVKKEIKSGKKKTKTPEPEPVEETESEIDDGEETEEIEEEETEETESTDDSDERELEVGDIVEVPYKGKDVAATVVSIDEATSSVKVQIGNKRLVVPLEKVYLLEG